MYNVLKFEYARNAFEYIINFYDIGEIYIPYYLCDVIRHSAHKQHCRIKFYHIDDKFYPAQEFPTDSFILYPNYFGICDKNVSDLVKIYPNLIVDNAHAYYSRPCGLCCFNSAMKFGYGKGAYLYIFANDSGLSNVVQEIDEGKKQKSRKKFLVIQEIFSGSNCIKDIDIDSIPFCYPYLAVTIKEADELVRDLTENGLTIYRYWNSLPKNFLEYKFYSRLVPIPIQES